MKLPRPLNPLPARAPDPLVCESVSLHLGTWVPPQARSSRQGCWHGDDLCYVVTLNYTPPARHEDDTGSNS